MYHPNHSIASQYKAFWRPVSLPATDMIDYMMASFRRLTGLPPLRNEVNVGRNGRLEVSYKEKEKDDASRNT